MAGADMKLIKEILVDVLKKGDVFVTLGNKEADIRQIVNDKCYLALSEIKEIIENPIYSDETCFEKIEKIVCVFESIGSNGGSRHDFG